MVKITAILKLNNQWNKKFDLAKFVYVYSTVVFYKSQFTVYIFSSEKR